MEWKQLPLGPLQTNAYLIYQKNGDCLIIDPGEEPDKIAEWVRQKKLNPKAILLTHAHFDHIGAVDDIRAKYEIPVYVHEQEKSWLSDPAKNGSAFFAGLSEITAKGPDYTWNREEEMTIEGFVFSLLYTPGHSPGSVSFYFPEQSLVISGDALFQGSIGRTDLPGGDGPLLLKSIHQKLLTLPEDTYVLPGHGQVTTISDEMDSNPFLNGFSI
ncbi:MBL fold metallo-hydrolase [Jeotgalibacillus sp. R-1-5s-1]|uniref:MBL fold metallo-hydrolase n=1 Tax=Jeotgalibacillus sp. R-1-5s-1 TaxID=2555897 RepID=UPI00106DA030|nr:MBL fold metallo-hydrolase [Jeotgalibacillus sp. R-1-5s-1]TFD92282.1 MBL fold metallo-hydrolase [Jeotgalibacillus sp. R-1-5s-1]